MHCSNFKVKKSRLLKYSYVNLNLSDMYICIYVSMYVFINRHQSARPSACPSDGLASYSPVFIRNDSRRTRKWSKRPVTVCTAWPVTVTFNVCKNYSIKEDGIQCSAFNQERYKPGKAGTWKAEYYML